MVVTFAHRHVTRLRRPIALMRAGLPGRPFIHRAMSDTSKADPFGHPGQAQDYAKFRPSYPPEIISELVATAEARGLAKEGLLVDVCTGTGVLLAQLATHFRQAMGFDRSTAQLSAAVQGPNIEYRQADAYSIPLPDKSVDLITIAQGIHWLEIPRFGRECERLLKPQGVLVALGYAYSVLSDARAHALFLKWYATLEPYWECDRHLLDSALANTDFGPLQETRRVELAEERTLSLDSYIGYLKTWSAYNTWRAKHPEAPDSLAELHEALRDLLGADAVLSLKTPFFAVYAERRAQA